MKFLHPTLFAHILLLAILLCSFPCKALDCLSNQFNGANVITVKKDGTGNSTTVQGAINLVPDNNNQWIHIILSPETYIEKVQVPVKKTCIFLEGSGSRSTSIEWGDGVVTSNSSTFTSYADNLVVKGVTFKNTYNLQADLNAIAWTQAVAARMQGDKCAFFQCAFLGVQDTLWDEKQRHYFNQCYIEGAVDFIFGRAQSIYENCVVSVNIERFAPGLVGYITAQKKEWPDYESGFVFKECVFKGQGKAYLGRAWGPYSTVIIAQSTLTDVVDPRGWYAWNYVGHEANFTYAETRNSGPGADSSRRVPWEKKLSTSELAKFLDISFINADGWLQKIPAAGYTTKKVQY